MPVMSGIEATQVIRSNPNINPQPVILALTANAMTSDRDKCLAAGMDGHISKPVKTADLQNNIEQFCGPGRRSLQRGGLLMVKSGSVESEGSAASTVLEVEGENGVKESGAVDGKTEGTIEKEEDRKG